MENTTNDNKEIIDQYHETFYKDLHGGKDYNITSKGFGHWYYDCLPGDKNAQILDIGCGDGKFLFFLQNSGYKQLEGLELSFQQVAEAKKHVNCPIHLVDNTISFLKKSPSTYHMITMNDVLEHIQKEETVEILKTVYNAIRPGGEAVISVPQVSGLSSFFCRYNDFTHETIFTEMSLKQVIFSAGFSKIRFVPEKWPIKWTLRHFAYRLARFLWFSMLKIIYTIESPGEKHPYSFQERLVAVATRSRNGNDVCSIDNS